jgi:hypothetical protein
LTLKFESPIYPISIDLRIKELKNPGKNYIKENHIEHEEHKDFYCLTLRELRVLRGKSFCREKHLSQFSKKTINIRRPV